MNIGNYEKFLKVLNEDLEKIFEYQKEYIFCKEGCSLCCEKGEYPFSELEFKYLMIGFETLQDDIKAIIKKNIEEIKNSDEKLYKCPFLTNNKCSVYHYRGLICRTFGVLSQKESGSIAMPFCCHEGLNYSSIYDEKKQKFSSEMYFSQNFKNPPKDFNLSNKNLMNSNNAKELNLSFGEQKRLIDWL